MIASAYLQALLASDDDLEEPSALGEPNGAPRRIRSR